MGRRRPRGKGYPQFTGNTGTSETQGPYDPDSFDAQPDLGGPTGGGAGPGAGGGIYISNVNTAIAQSQGAGGNIGGKGQTTGPVGGNKPPKKKPPKKDKDKPKK